MRKIIFAASGILMGVFLILIAGAGYMKIWDAISLKIGPSSITGAVANATTERIKEDPVPTPLTKLIFVGDIMLDRGVESSINKNFNGDFNRIFENVGELKDADIFPDIKHSDHCPIYVELKEK